MNRREIELIVLHGLLSGGMREDAIETMRELVDKFLEDDDEDS